MAITRAAGTTPPGVSDATLVARHRRGEDGAFAELHNRYAPGLLRAARGRVDAACAEDVVQDAFERAHRFLLSDPRAASDQLALGAWLHTVVRHRCADELRRPRRLVELSDDLAAWQSEPDRSAEQSQALEAVLAALAEMPARQRQALLAHAVAGEPHAAVAARLQTTVPATKALVNRARSGLRDRLAA